MIRPVWIPIPPMKVPFLSLSCLDAACLLVVFLLGCSSEPAADRSSRPGNRVPNSLVQARSLIGWSNSTLAPQERKPDSWSFDMPGIDENDSIEDPHGRDESMIQRITVCGFGEVDKNMAFLTVDDSARTIQEGNTILGFQVIKIENPFVTFSKAGRTWKLSTARKQAREENQYRNLIPLSPPIFHDKTTPEDMVWESIDFEHEMIESIDPAIEDSDQNILDPARALETGLDEPEDP